ncbi:MAG: DUF1963 domain-containing protein [Rhodobacteraceae bacterium]|nr:DUF1963 domain-containing protein [Paracoccaceae bacterium]
MYVLVIMFVIISASALAIYLLKYFVWQPQIDREAEAAPRITLAEAKGFWEAIEKDTLPMAKAQVQNRAPLSPSESRIGGPALAIGDDHTWPHGDNQTQFPMEMIAQINFADLPELEDFPSSGILQIFTSFEMLNDSGECDRVIRWEPNPTGEKMLEIPPELKKKHREVKDLSLKTRRIGLPLTFVHQMAPGNFLNLPYAESDPIYENRLGENDEVEAMLAGWEERGNKIIEAYGTHWVGGHPSFIQEDIRDCGDRQDLNRVLFHMGYDHEINVGNAGDVNVLISREALLARDFQKAFLTWDCS